MRNAVSKRKGSPLTYFRFAGDPFLFPIIIIPPPNLSNFDPTTFSEIRNLIFSSQNKQCELDSIPTFLLKLCFDELGPTIINIINFSLSEGIFPSSFKQVRDPLCQSAIQ